MQVALLSDMRWAWVLACSASAVGCMVPSFDGMQQEANATEPAEAGAPNGGGSSSNAIPPPGAPGAPGAVPDAGADASTGAKTFACSGASRPCELGSEICCWDGISSTTCQPNASSGSSACGGGFLRCTDTKDCPSGNQCCMEVPPSDLQVAVCRTTCNGGERVSCDPATPTCSGGTTCSGTVGYGLHYCK